MDGVPTGFCHCSRFGTAPLIERGRGAEGWGPSCPHLPNGLARAHRESPHLLFGLVWAQSKSPHLLFGLVWAPRKSPHLLFGLVWARPNSPHLLFGLVWAPGPRPSSCHTSWVKDLIAPLTTMGPALQAPPQSPGVSLSPPLWAPAWTTSRH